MNKMSKQNILKDAGRITTELAKDKAEKEYEVYKNKNQNELTEVERHFLEAIETAEKKLRFRPN